MSTPRRSSDTTRLPASNMRPALQSILHHPTTSTTAIPTTQQLSQQAERSLSFPNLHSPKGKQTAHHNPSRIIKTFEEVEVTKIVMAEEWYEELECGICSHILGTTQSLVPCGHSFCGPCTWQWIKTNKNYTCPHCRVQVPENTPFIPNIIVDQIIERKLKALPESKEKKEMLVELKEKLEEWKVIQSANPTKPVAPKRGRSFEDFLNLIAPPNDHRQAQGHRRRASGALHELGAPIPVVSTHRPTRPYTNLNLADLLRLHAEEDAVLGVATATEMRRLREINQRQVLALAALAEVDDDNASEAPQQGSRHRSERHQNSSNPAPETSQETHRRIVAASNQRPDRTVPAPAVVGGVRPNTARFPGRSDILANRQARGREIGSRDAPLVVLSDSE